MDFFKNLTDKLGTMNDESVMAARKAYGDAYDKASPMKQAAMRAATSGAFKGGSGSSDVSGTEQDLGNFLSIKPGTPSMANPMQAYSSLYNMYGGRKTRGLLFD
jgi:hypothetical protein